MEFGGPGVFGRWGWHLGVFRSTPESNGGHDPEGREQEAGDAFGHEEKD